jgi:uncharacterized repeat protein (TIGR03803 family)
MKTKLLLFLLLFPVLTFAQTYTFTTLVSFPPTSKKSAVNPGAPIIDSIGNLYGISPSGGRTGGGTVWKVTPNGVLSVVFSFVFDPNFAGSFTPKGELARDGAGNFYGTTTNGGSDGFGTYFKVSPQGKETVLQDVAPKDFPGSLTLRAGVLYGFSPYFVFAVSPTGKPITSCPYCVRVDGGGLGNDRPIFDQAGNLYGTTFPIEDPEYGGTVFKISPQGALTTLYAFDGSVPGDAGSSWFRPTRDAAGNLYGASGQGGAFGQGAVFKVTPTGKESVLHSFCSAANCRDGSTPAGPVIIDTNGNLYGVTVGGGANGYGVVYKITPAGVETVLWSAAGSAGLGSALVKDTAGNLYGTTRSGGRAHTGSVYKLTKH